jgi:hypothetical protein
MTPFGFLIRLLVFSMITWFHYGITESIVSSVSFALVPIVYFEMLRSR